MNKNVEDSVAISNVSTDEPQISFDRDCTLEPPKTLAEAIDECNRRLEQHPKYNFRSVKIIR